MLKELNLVISQNKMVIIRMEGFEGSVVISTIDTTPTVIVKSTDAPGEIPSLHMFHKQKVEVE